MRLNPDTVGLWQRQAATVLVVARKDARVYYLKAPVLTFGLVFPVFISLVFAAGRAMPPETFVPGMLAMLLFFSASSVGPLVTPWERQAGTYERLLTSPASLEAILLGDLLAGATFGVLATLSPLVVGIAATPARVVAPVQLALGLLLGALAFAALGVLLAARHTAVPSEVIMLSNLVRMPLIFVSGIFSPLGEMPAWRQAVGLLSPLSYSMDLVRGGLGEPRFFPAWLSVSVLLGFSLSFFLLARFLDRRQRRAASR